MATAKKDTKKKTASKASSKKSSAKLKFKLPQVKLKKPSLSLGSKKTKVTGPKSVDENLRPESRVAKYFNKASSKASEVGAKEVGNPTPTTGKLAKRVDPLAPIKWLFRYVRDSIKELKQVTWPTRSQAWRLTGTVGLFSALMALLLFGIDSGFNKLFEVVFLDK